MRLARPSVVAMHAQRPEDLPRVFQQHFNAGDVAALTRDYYAPAATYAPMPGVVVDGDEVRPTIARLVALGKPMDVIVRHVLVQAETALLVVDWAILELGMSGTATDVARRQPDGTWRCLIDNPHGGAATVELPAATAAALGE